MVTLGLYWGYTRIMEKKMETAILGFRVIVEELNLTYMIPL